MVSWLLIAWGVLTGLPIIFYGSWRGIIAGLFMGLAFIIPGAWHLMNARLEADGLPRTPRRWGRVLAGCLALNILGGVILPENVGSTPSPTSETSTPRNITTRTTTPSPEPALQPAATVPEENVEPAPEAPVQNFVPEVPQQTPEPAPQPAPDPQPVYTPPPAAPVQDSGNVYYRNCSAARAAGAAPIYLGQPGYGTHLDRDLDGIACE